MNPHLSARLTKLRSDYQSFMGRPFDHFFCPILFRDEPSALCKGHIVNEAFRDAPRRWTVQRADVDGFYGSTLESEFVAIQERGGYTSTQLLTDNRLRQTLRPKLTVDGEEVPHFYPSGAITEAHTEVELDHPTVRLALKMAPSETLSKLAGTWEVRIDKDVRVAALGSLLKAGYLTLFDLLGYRYPLSAGGRIVGYEALGTFFLANMGRAKPDVLTAAQHHFAGYMNLVRPILSGAGTLQGTISDRIVYFVGGSLPPWGIITIVRAGGSLHAVLMPSLDDPEAAERFTTFLSTPFPRLFVRAARLTPEHWEVSTQETTFTWPEPSFV